MSLKRFEENSWMALVLGLVLVVIFYWNNIFQNAVNITPYVGTNDFMDLNIPFRHFLIESLKRGEFPLWAANVSSGYPLLAEGFGGLYPLNLVASLLPLLLSVKFTLISNYFLLFCFSFLYFKQVGLKRRNAFLAAMFLTFSGFAVNQLQHWEIIVSYYLFIGKLYLLERFLGSGRLGWLLGMALLLGFAILGGHAQINFYGVLFIFLYWLFMWSNRKLSYVKFFIYFFLFCLLGAGIGAGQFMPMYEFTGYSTRSTGITTASLSRFNFPVADVKEFFSAFAIFDKGETFDAYTRNGWPKDEMYIYPGLAVSILALSLLLTRRLNRYAVFFIFMFLASLIFAFGTQLGTGYILTLPPFNFFRLPFRIFFITSLALAYLAAYGFEVIEKRYSTFFTARKGVFLAVLMTVAVLFFGDVYYHAKRLYPEVDGNKWYQEPRSVEYLKENLRNQERVSNLPYFVRVFAERPDLWENWDIHRNMRNTLPIFNNLLYGVPANVGAANSGGLKIQRYFDLEAELFYKGITGDSEGRIEVSDKYLFLNRLMGVRYILSTFPIKTYITQPVEKIEFDTGQDPVYINEFSDYFTRTFMVPAAEKVGKEEILRRFKDVSFDPRMSVLLEEDYGDWGAKGGFVGSAEITDYEEQRVKIKTEASGDGFLFLADTYYPGWSAYVDGNKDKIYLANYAFRAVAVPRGKHEVEFRYEPRSFYWGIRISIVNLIAWLILIVVARRLQIL